MTDPPHDPTICENCGGVATYARKALSDAEAMLGMKQMDISDLRARIAALEAEREDKRVGYERLLAFYLGQYRERVAALEAERDHWHSAAAKRREALEECAAYFKAQKCKGAPYLLVAEALTPEEKP
jgi:chromosome segregation ATPase